VEAVRQAVVGVLHDVDRAENAVLDPQPAVEARQVEARSLVFRAAARRQLAARRQRAVPQRRLAERPPDAQPAPDQPQAVQRDPGPLGVRALGPDGPQPPSLVGVLEQRPVSLSGADLQPVARAQVQRLVQLVQGVVLDLNDPAPRTLQPVPLDQGLFQRGEVGAVRHGGRVAARRGGRHDLEHAGRPGQAADVAAAAEVGAGAVVVADPGAGIPVRVAVEEQPAQLGIHGHLVRLQTNAPVEQVGRHDPLGRHRAGRVPRVIA
jgi:hypothetical protein